MSAACMGGWACPERNRCAHYHNTQGQPVVERICEAGETDAFERVVIRREPGTWERPHLVPLLKPATWLGALEA